MAAAAASAPGRPLEPVPPVLRGWPLLRPVPGLLLRLSGASGSRPGVRASGQVARVTPEERDELLYRTGYASGWARCACCGHEGYRWPNGFCGTCHAEDHTACIASHLRIRRSNLW